ncbi:MAG: deoxynucleoside kinase [Deltaproteobacteria bacterium HGW-Deltaproteobacteria-14]|jgi:deoxyadenosine kinase|nr:MAG: deoxynucleoside kinase [Deltaproteobacteria bacterium HGW-Deltaproteobacteria-14]
MTVPVDATNASLANAFIGTAGLIGVGKTTLADSLGAHLGLDVYHEPVDDNAYLADFYADTARHAFAMQVYLLNRRFAQHQEIIWRSRGAVQDRTIYEDSIFAKVLVDMGLMDPRDYQTYVSLFTNLSRFMCKPTAIVYLHSSPETCFKRIQARGRGVEKVVTLEYLQRLYAAYEEFVLDISRTIPVIQVDWENFGDIEALANRITTEVSRASYLRRVTM